MGLSNKTYSFYELRDLFKKSSSAGFEKMVSAANKKGFTQTTINLDELMDEISERFDTNLEVSMSDREKIISIINGMKSVDS
jgi:hypothetical protein